jgi:hypothetical protein
MMLQEFVRILDAEEQIQKRTGCVEVQKQPDERWRKRDWEGYAAYLEQTLAGIVKHQTGPGLVRDMPRVLCDRILGFLLPHRPSPTPWEHVQDYIMLGRVCKQWKACVDGVIATNPGLRSATDLNVADLSMRSILETGMVCMYNCPSDCADWANDYYQKHQQRLEWKHLLE